MTEMFAITQDYYDDSRFLGTADTTESAMTAAETMANLSSPVWMLLNNGVLTTEQGEGYISIRPSEMLEKHPNDYSNYPPQLSKAQ